MAYSLFTCLEFTISVSLNNQALDFVQLNGKNKLWRYKSLRGGRLKGKGKGVLGARETRFPRAQNPLSLPFQTPATQAIPPGAPYAKQRKIEKLVLVWTDLFIICQGEDRLYRCLCPLCR